MTLSIDSLSDATHLLTFLVGAVTGAAATYLADKYTDKRRKAEQSLAENLKLDKLRLKMPQLLKEMAVDLAEDASSVTREFVAMPNRVVSFNSSKPRFSYFETDHPHLKNQVSMLLAESFVADLALGSASIYRIEEHLVSALQR